MNPVAGICHVLAIVIGAWGGYTLMTAVTPDFPGPDTPPAVAAEPASEPESADSEESFYRSAGFASGLSRLSDQFGADERIRRLRVEPDQLNADSADDDELIEIVEIPVTATQVLADAIIANRPGVTYDSIAYMELVATPNGPRWYAQLVTTDPDLPPPWTYTAPIEGSPVKVGAAPPEAIGE